MISWLIRLLSFWRCHQSWLQLQLRCSQYLFRLLASHETDSEHCEDCFLEFISFWKRLMDKSRNHIIKLIKNELESFLSLVRHVYSGLAQCHQDKVQPTIQNQSFSSTCSFCITLQRSIPDQGKFSSSLKAVWTMKYPFLALFSFQSYWCIVDSGFCW